MLRVKAEKSKGNIFLWNAKKPNKKCKFCLNYEKLSCKIFDCAEKRNFLNDGRRTKTHLFLIEVTERRF